MRPAEREIRAMKPRPAEREIRAMKPRPAEREIRAMKPRPNECWGSSEFIREKRRGVWGGAPS